MLSPQNGFSESYASRIIRDQWKQHHRPYAVFDADGTLWKGDVSESLLAKMENDGTLSPDSLPSCLKLLPFYPDEGLYSYYLRLCGLNKKIGYQWIAMVFSGFSLETLQQQVDALMALNQPIPVRIFSEKGVEDLELSAPKVFTLQTQLISALRAEGIEVFVVTAALETLCRMIASNPQYGLKIPPQNIIGVNLVLKDSSLADTHPIIPGRGNWKAISSQELFPFVFPPVSMSFGKECAIREYIHPIHRPILVAGNSADDLQMLFYCDVEAGGCRLFVVDEPRRQQEIVKEIGIRSALQKECGQINEAGQGWLFLPDENLD